MADLPAPDCPYCGNEMVFDMKDWRCFHGAVELRIVGLLLGNAQTKEEASTIVKRLVDANLRVKRGMDPRC